MMLFLNVFLKLLLRMKHKDPKMGPTVTFLCCEPTKKTCNSSKEQMQCSIYYFIKPFFSFLSFFFKSHQV